MTNTREYGGAPQSEIYGEGLQRRPLEELSLLGAWRQGERVDLKQVPRPVQVYVGLSVTTPEIMT